MAWIPPTTPSKYKRPVSYVSIAQHIGKWKSVINPSRILDVGFGRGPRSTKALQEVFPAAHIDAIDNDLHLVNEFSSKGPPRAESGVNPVRYLFGDADMWLPKHNDYDLVVICHAAHAFHHPLRATANLVEANLKPGGHILFVHRTDPVMQATNLWHADFASGSEADKVWKIWEEIAKAWERMHPGVPLTLPWQTSFVSEHEALHSVCLALGLVPVQPISIKTEHAREREENLSDVLGTKSEQKEPQYQAPRFIWRDLKSNWPQYDDFTLRSKVCITSFLYQKPATPAFAHSSGLPALICPTRIPRFSLEPHEDHRNSSRVRSWLKTSFGPVLVKDIRSAFFSDKSDTSLLWGDVPPELPAHLKLPDNTFTKAIINSERVWPHHSGEYDFRLFLLPALSSSQAHELDWVMPMRATQTLGLDSSEVFLIPLLDDENTLKKVLGRWGFDGGEHGDLARYLRARGKWVQGEPARCSAIYYFVFRSTLLDPENNCQAISFLARRWLEPDAVRDLTNIANAYLHALIERRIQDIGAEQKAAKDWRASHETEVIALKQRLQDSSNLSAVFEHLNSVQFTEDDPALKGGYDKLGEGSNSLARKIIGAALHRTKDENTAIEYISPKTHQGNQTKRNDSNPVDKFFAKHFHPKSLRGLEFRNEAIRDAIKEFGGDADSFHYTPLRPRRKKLVAEVQKPATAKKSKTSRKG